MVFRAFRIVVFAVSIFAGGVLGGLMGSAIPILGTAGGAVVGGALAFAVALEILDRFHAYLVSRAEERYLTEQAAVAQIAD